MGDTNDIASVIEGLRSFGGSDSYHEWASDTLIMTSLTHRDESKVMQGALRPGSPAATSTATPHRPVLSDMNTDPAGQIRRWDYACQTLFSILHLTKAGSAKLLVQTYAGESGGPGNGQAAWLALKDKYVCCTKETRRANYEALVDTRMKQGQDPDDYFMLLDQRRVRLRENGEVISDERFEDIILRGITSDTIISATPAIATRNLDGRTCRRQCVECISTSCRARKSRGTWGGQVSSSHLLRLQESISVFQL